MSERTQDPRRAWFVDHNKTSKYLWLALSSDGQLLLSLVWSERAVRSMLVSQCPCWCGGQATTWQPVKAQPICPKKLFHILFLTTIFSRKNCFSHREVGENIYIFFNFFWLAHNWEVFGIAIGTLHSLWFTGPCLCFSIYANSLPCSHRSVWSHWILCVWKKF